LLCKREKGKGRKKQNRPALREKQVKKGAHFTPPTGGVMKLFSPEHSGERGAQKTKPAPLCGKSNKKGAKINRFYPAFCRIVKSVPALRQWVEKQSRSRSAGRKRCKKRTGRNHKTITQSKTGLLCKRKKEKGAKTNQFTAPSVKKTKK
jgi:hypothetical protein